MGFYLFIDDSFSKSPWAKDLSDDLWYLNNFVCILLWSLQ